ncbi:MAG: hypothetical protein AAF975_05545 [Spirochaetota bacterium]
MFLALLLLTFALALGISWLVIKAFDGPVSKIFSRIIQDKIAAAWQKYIRFAACVTGISGGVRIYELERYITGENNYEGTDSKILELNGERWVLEVYRTVIETLQSLAWMYLLVFLLALLAFAIIRGFELKIENNGAKKNRAELHE